MGHGFKEGMANGEYRSRKEFISITELKLFKYSPYKYKHEVLCGNKKESSSSQKLGTLFHLAMLEPSEFEKVAAFPDLRSAKAKEAVAAGKFVCNQDDYNNVVAARHAVLKNEHVRKVLNEDCKTELSAFWRHPMGVDAKCRFDAINLKQNIIFDVKTCRDLEEFKRQIKWYGYDMQAAFYTDCAQILYGEPFKFQFLVVEMNEPYLYKIFEMTQKRQVQASQKYEAILEKYKYAIENDYFPHPSEEIEMLEPEQEYGAMYQEITEISKGEK